MDIQFSKVLDTPKLQNKFRDQGKQIYILDYYCVESSVILYQIEGAIFLLDEENQCNHKVLRRPYLHSTEIFSNEYIKL